MTLTSQSEDGPVPLRVGDRVGYLRSRGSSGWDDAFVEFIIPAAWESPELYEILVEPDIPRLKERVRCGREDLLFRNHCHIIKEGAVIDHACCGRIRVVRLKAWGKTQLEDLMLVIDRHKKSFLMTAESLLYTTEGTLSDVVFDLPEILPTRKKQNIFRVGDRVVVVGSVGMNGLRGVVKHVYQDFMHINLDAAFVVVPGSEPKSHLLLCPDCLVAEVDYVPPEVVIRGDSHPEDHIMDSLDLQLWE